MAKKKYGTKRTAKILAKASKGYYRREKYEEAGRKSRNKARLKRVGKTARRLTKPLYKKKSSRKILTSIVTGGGRRGRPEGTYKYYIPGRGPVDIYTYRKYVALQKAKERLSRGKGGMTAEEYIERQKQRYGAPRSSQRQPRREFRKPNILNARNPLQDNGQMWKDEPARNPVPHALDQQKPITNPRGEYYTEVDPASGRPLIRRRPSERWISGDRED